MGSICSKDDTAHSSKNKDKKVHSEKVADLENTLKDDIHPHKLLQHTKPSKEEDEQIVPVTNNKRKKEELVSNDGIAGLTSITLDGDFDLKEKVKLPDNVQLEQWIYTNLMDFVETTSILYDSIVDVCTPEVCPEMAAGSHYSYYWTDFNGSDPVPMSAREYILTLFQSISDVFSNPPFNACDKGEFPESFMYMCRAIFKKLFRVYAHVYHHHLIEFTKNGTEAHLNTSFKRFVLFEREFKMISTNEELPLRKLIYRLVEDEEDNSTPEDLRSVMKRSQNSKSYRHSSTTDSSE